MSNPHSLQRREFLHSSLGSYLGLSLGGLLQAQSALADSPRRSSAQPRIRSCILLFYYGGPSHLDTFDMKPNAPAEVRGEFQPIATSVPGLQISEHLPRIARIMNKVALVRGMHHRNTLHDSASIETLTGRPSPNGDREELSPIEQFFPCHGSILSYLWRNRHAEVPFHTALPYAFRNVIPVPCQRGGFLGARFDPLQVNVELRSKTYHAGTLSLPDDLNLRRLDQRRGLLQTLDANSTTSATTAVRQLRGFYDRAYRLLESEALRRALDIRQEPQSLRERYGFDEGPRDRGEGGGGNNGGELGLFREMRGQNLLMARRLVEAGVPFVNVYDFQQQGRNWDAHFKCFSQHKNFLLPITDRSFSALIEDLDSRGLLDSTLVVGVGEFGRTPRINGEGGRDHWPFCYTVVLAGGGVKGGYVHGSSDRIGAYPAANPVTPADLAATIFWRFGIDPRTEIHDLTGRPFPISTGEPIRELFQDG